MEYGIKYYIYEPEIEIENLEKVNQCLICQDNYNNRNNYNDCTCSCEEIDDDCTCYQILENKITVPPKKE
jgi:hypothetical protein